MMTTKEKITFLILNYLRIKDYQALILAEQEIKELAKFYRVNRLNQGQKSGNILKTVENMLVDQKGFNELLPKLYADIQDLRQKHAEKTK